MNRKDDFTRTIAYGETAISQLKASRTPAYPRHYELWYTYAAGFNGELNGAVNAILKQRGSLTLDETCALYEAHLSPVKIGEQLDDVSGQIAGEIDRVLSLVEANASTTSSYGSSLQGATQALGRTQDKEQVKSIVQTLISTTRSIESNNKALEAQLVESKRQIDVLQERLEAVRYESMTDELTGLSNRKHFGAALERCLADAGGGDIALLILDIDHFKKFNDNYGHQTGDQVLRLVAAALRQSARNQDTAARYGGEEFAVIVPDATLEQAARLAERIRVSVMNKELVRRSTGEHLGRITVSVGVAILHRADTAETLIARADMCLYAAKRAGRNAVRTEADEAASPAQSVA